MTESTLEGVHRVGSYGPSKKLEVGMIVEVNYVNYEGKTSIRKIRIEGFFFGVTEWHPRNQLFLQVFDMERKVYRAFAAEGILEVF